MIGLTKRSHVAPKMQHVIFCDSIVRFDWCRTNLIDSVCGVTPMRERRICDPSMIPLCAKDGSVITWGRGEGETLSHHVVSTQCAVGLKSETSFYQQILVYLHEKSESLIKFSCIT